MYIFARYRDFSGIVGTGWFCGESIRRKLDLGNAGLAGRVVVIGSDDLYAGQGAERLIDEDDGAGGGA